jgi:hypothetical protein
MHWHPDETKGGWDVLRKPPSTPWGEDQIALSKRPEERFFDLWNSGERLDYDGSALAIQREANKPTEVTREDFAAHFDAFMHKNHGGRELIGNETALSQLCKRFCPGFFTKRPRVDRQKVKMYVFPSLSPEG